MQNSFYTYYLARKMENLSDDDRFIPVFSSSNIRVYPFQIAAANFALRSPYQKGVILCDEAGMGKSHEAMIVISQKWYEGKNRILIAIPNIDLLSQWVEMIEAKYTIPFVVITNREEWKANTTPENPNAFLQDAIIITTYDFLADQQAAAQEVTWDITIFEEANYLSSVYEENTGIKAKILKEIAENSFKILLTGTPIEKNIMDLYGLIYFIDENILPDSETYTKRYLRKPENYPELAEKVSKYCFRTLRSQAKQYAKIPERIHITLEYEKSAKEQELYNLLYAYMQKPNKIAFPQMEQYDLSLLLLGILGSSTAAIVQTLCGVVKRLLKLEVSSEELVAEINEFEQIISLGKTITTDSKAQELLFTLHKIFPILKQMNANKKAVIFTEYSETAKMLYNLLSDKYKTPVYNSKADYNALKTFKSSGEVLISTDIGAKGFNLEECSFLINYDLLYNTLKMEQRIDRCHRLNQENDVIVLSFIDKQNFADVRKLELVSKRHILTSGVFGVSDSVIGGFYNNIDTALKELSSQIRTKAQVESDYQNTLKKNEFQNKEIITSAEDVLFTTFTKELRDKMKITPKYVEEKSKEINADLWQVVKSFIETHNLDNDDFEIDETNKTITAKTEKPFLFYYWTGSGNKKYLSLKSYGMGDNFSPKSGRITLSSVFGRGIIHNIECSNKGKICVSGDAKPCSIALYLVNLKPANKTYPILIGKTESGDILTDAQCQEILALPVKLVENTDRSSACWLKNPSNYNELDKYVDTETLINNETENLSDIQKEEIERIKLRSKIDKNALVHTLDDLQRELKTLENELLNCKADRMKTLSTQRKITLLKREIMSKQESQFFEEMQLDVELENKINEFLGKEKITAKLIRQFVVHVEGK